MFDEFNEHENDVDQNTSKNHADRISFTWIAYDFLTHIRQTRTHQLIAFNNNKISSNSRRKILPIYVLIFP